LDISGTGSVFILSRCFLLYSGEMPICWG